MRCIKCSKQAAYKCEHCCEPYCSVECQKSNWKAHRRDCFIVPYSERMKERMKASMDYYSLSDSFHKQHGNDFNNTHRSVAPPIDSKFLEDTWARLGAKPSPVRQRKVLTVSTTDNNVEFRYWKTAFSHRVGEFFEAVVNFVEEPEKNKFVLWIMDIEYGNSLYKLMRQINRHVDRKTPCDTDYIRPNALVIVPIELRLYRAEVLDTATKSQEALVRLVDYGNKLYLPYNKLYRPLRITRELNAFAIRVTLDNFDGPLEIKSIINIRIIDEYSRNGVYNAEYKNNLLPLIVPLEILEKQPPLSLIKCFPGGHKALLQFDSSDNLLNVSDEDMDAMESDRFVAARTLKGWLRARLLGHYKKKFLVYALDEGTVVWSTQIKRIPDEYIGLPIKVLAISNSIKHKLSDLAFITFSKLSLKIGPRKNKKKKSVQSMLNAGLYADEHKIDNIKLSVFSGLLCELNLKVWHENIEEGCVVYVTNVFSYKQIFIAACDIKKYRKIFRYEISTCPRFGIDESIKSGDVVLVCENKANQYYRGEILKVLNVGRSSTFEVLNVDRGSTQSVQRRYLRKPSMLIRSLPVRCFLKNLMFLEDVNTTIEKNKALSSLESYVKKNIKFYITYNKSGSIDLFDTVKRESVCKRLLSMLFEPQEELQASTTHSEQITLDVAASFERTGLSQSPLDSSDIPRKATELLRIYSSKNAPLLTALSSVTYTLNDLELMPIKCGTGVCLIALYGGDVLSLEESQFITVMNYSRPIVREMQRNLRMVKAHCDRSGSGSLAYIPKKMEICLVLRIEDGIWYRAVCLKRLINDAVLVRYLDYGNISEVKEGQMKRIVKELMFPIYANRVNVVGNIKTKERATAFMNYIRNYPVIYADVYKDEANIYFAKINNLEEMCTSLSFESETE
uniref:Tudor domain-containing protein n=1 Tax=Glossina brevipalpis TaxID=37001 RepID=A0A1A9W8G9_9MUSC